MRHTLRYEWTLETIQDGDIIDSDFADKVKSFDKADLIGNDLGLVRDEWSEHDGLEDRVWAYVKDGKLPVYFSDSMGKEINIKVPKRYHIELTKYFNDFEDFLNSDNVIAVEGGYREQTTQYRKLFTRSELFKFWIREYC